jgi:curved DNA-binding protein CbpA
MRCPLIRRLSDSRDYYRALGVKQDAKREEIREAYLKLVKIYHPDTPTGDTEKFKKIGEAWSVLGNQKNREIYDLETGEERKGFERERNEEVNEFERFNVFKHDPVKAELLRRVMNIPFVRKFIRKYPLRWAFFILFICAVGTFFGFFEEDGHERLRYGESFEDFFRQKRERNYYEDDND